MSSPGGGALYLVSTPIGNLSDLSERAVQVLTKADIIACEDTRHSGRLLVHAGIAERRLVSLNAHNENERAPKLVDEMRAGALVALVSDAGTPAISDPGERLVAAAIAADVPVLSVPGPCAGLAALVVSGFALERWSFEGFLARKGPARRERLAAIAASHHPCVIYEAPGRVKATIGDLAEVCGVLRRVAVARELTKLHEEVWRGELAEAVERYSAVEPRGEHVIVVDSALASEPIGEAELLAALGRLRDAGLGRRECVAAAKAVLGVSHKEAYAAALELFG